MATPALLGPDGACVRAVAWHEGLPTANGHNAIASYEDSTPLRLSTLFCQHIMAARMIRALSLSALLAALASVESRKVSLGRPPSFAHRIFTWLAFSPGSQLLARHWGHVEAFEAIRME